jgi:hypothetical protein
MERSGEKVAPKAMIQSWFAERGETPEFPEEAKLDGHDSASRGARVFPSNGGVLIWAGGPKREAGFLAGNRRPHFTEVGA